MNVFVLGDWKQLQEQIVGHTKWADQDADTPLLRSKSVIWVDTEGSSCEGNEDQLEANDNDNNAEENLVVENSFENV